jgi:hypothetical protein
MHAQVRRQGIARCERGQVRRRCLADTVENGAVASGHALKRLGHIAELVGRENACNPAITQGQLVRTDDLLVVDEFRVPE